jgi:DNA helicase-2/ATP-dependent DNA helicase PcrA
VSDASTYLKSAEDLRANPAQWAAYESKGHCVVLAGPGSGKTKTLTVKLARLLSEDIQEPRGLACITYSNECARELETRLAALGIEPGRRAFIGTVHSFSLTQIILPYAKAANMGLPDEFCVATRAERRRALGTAYEKVIGGRENPQELDFRMGTYRRSILNRNSAEWREADPEMASFVEAFEAELRAMDRIDFDDMPLLAVRALREHAWLQRAILAKYPVLVVDEYQDLGRALHRMVMGLCFSTGMRLFAVGDADQSIYEFNGANPQLLRELAARKDVECVRLRLNYRSGAKIVEASNYALGEARDYEAAECTDEGTVYFHPQRGSYEHQAAETFRTVIADVAKRHPDLEPGDIAILYPAAWLGDKIADVAQQVGLSVIRTDTNAIYPRTSRLMRWLERCAEWCTGGWQTGTPRFSHLVNEGARLFAEEISTSELRLTFQRALMDSLWSRRDSTVPLRQWLADVRADIIVDMIAKCRTLKDEGETLDAFIGRTQAGKDCADMTVAQFAGQGEGNKSLHLSTLHSAKGREFPIVIMFGMDQGNIPRKNSTDSQKLEARRLFYVGFTRAKSEVHVMHSDARPSPFVMEVKSRLDVKRA